MKTRVLIDKEIEHENIGILKRFFYAPKSCNFPIFNLIFYNIYSMSINILFYRKSETSPAMENVIIAIFWFKHAAFHHWQ